MLDFLKDYWQKSAKNKAILVLVSASWLFILFGILKIFLEVPGLAIGLGFTIILFLLLQGMVSLEEAYRDWKYKNPHR